MLPCWRLSLCASIPFRTSVRMHSSASLRGDRGFNVCVCARVCFYVRAGERTTVHPYGRDAAVSRLPEHASSRRHARRAQNTCNPALRSNPATWRGKCCLPAVPVASDRHACQATSARAGQPVALFLVSDYDFNLLFVFFLREDERQCRLL